LLVRKLLTLLEVLLHGSSVKWKQLQQTQSTRGGSGSCGMAAALNGSCCNKNNQLEVIAAAVVAWQQG